ncbi:MAG: hypothetical protein GOV01_03615, partial [Candidatus Altiarchaeota archaeon]|nr:hypothetical protein [Candidatus Altiarchaeota archaeon]
MLPKKNYDALKTILEAVRGHKINWMVIGSTNLALQGIDIHARDIDILTTKEGALALNGILANFVVEPVKLSENKKFRSWFGKFNVNGCEVEVIGDLQSYDPGGDLWGETEDFKDKITVKFHELKVPCISLKKEYDAYIRLGK